MKPVLVDLAQLGASSAYAAALDRWKHHIEPEGTWAEVVAGTAMCLLFAGLRTRQRRHPHWQDHQADVWRSFVIGGAPIIAWRLYRAVTMHRRGFEVALRHLRAGDGGDEREE